jgi:hypothetical protein
VATRTIEAFPRGLTTGELLSLLDVQHDSKKRLEILRVIEGLSRQGVIRSYAPLRFGTPRTNKTQHPLLHLLQMTQQF